jgi:hypothetical protein
MAVVGISLALPFLVMGCTEPQVKRQPSAGLIIRLIWVGLLLILLSAVFEELLKRAWP